MSEDTCCATRDPALIEELFILNARGDLLASKVYLGERCGEEMYEAAFAATTPAEETGPFHLPLWQRHLVHVQRNDVHLFGSRRDAAEGALALSLLLRVYEVLDAFLSVVDEETILANTFLVSELLEEVIFLGLPFCLSIYTLKHGRSAASLFPCAHLTPSVS